MSNILERSPFEIKCIINGWKTELIKNNDVMTDEDKSDIRESISLLEKHICKIKHCVNLNCPRCNPK